MKKVYLVINEIGFDPEGWRVPLTAIISSAHATAEGAAEECDRLRSEKTKDENERVDHHNKLVALKLAWINAPREHVTPEYFRDSIYIEERELLP